MGNDIQMLNSNMIVELRLFFSLVITRFCQKETSVGREIYFL